MVFFSTTTSTVAAAAGGCYYLIGSGATFMSAWFMGVMEGKIVYKIIPEINCTNNGGGGMSSLRYGTVSIPYTLLGQNVPLPSISSLSASTSTHMTTTNMKNMNNNNNNNNMDNNNISSNCKDDSKDLRNQYQWNRRRSLKLSRPNTTTTATTINNHNNNHNRVTKNRERSTTKIVVVESTSASASASTNSHLTTTTTTMNQKKLWQDVFKIQDSFRHVRVVCLTGSIALLAAHLWQQLQQYPPSLEKEEEEHPNNQNIDSSSNLIQRIVISPSTNFSYPSFSFSQRQYSTKEQCSQKSNDDNDGIIHETNNSLSAALPMEIVNPNIMYGTSSNYYCQRKKISSKIQWNKLRYQSKYPNSNIIPIYYHYHLHHHHNHHHPRIHVDDDDIICISSWQLISNILYQIMQKSTIIQDSSFSTTKETSMTMSSSQSFIETNNPNISSSNPDMLSDDKSLNLVKEESCTDMDPNEDDDNNNNNNNNDENDSTKYTIPVSDMETQISNDDSNNNNYSSESTIYQDKQHSPTIIIDDDDDTTISSSSSDNLHDSTNNHSLVKKDSWKYNTIVSSCINNLLVGIGKHIRLTWNSYWNNMLFLTHIVGRRRKNHHLPSSDNTKKKKKRLLFFFTSSSNNDNTNTNIHHTTSSHHNNNKKKNHTKHHYIKNDILNTIQSYLNQKQQLAVEEEKELNNNGSNNSSNDNSHLVYDSSSIITIADDAYNNNNKSMWNEFLVHDEMEDDDIVYYCVIWGDSDDETCILSNKLWNHHHHHCCLEQQEQEQQKSWKVPQKMVIIPIFKQSSSVLEFKEFVVSSSMQSSSLFPNTSIEMELICLQDIQEQAFQQARQQLPKKNAKNIHGDDNDDVSSSTTTTFGCKSTEISRELSNFIPHTTTISLS